MLIASNGHFFGQIPHPMHSRSDMKAIFESEVTSMHNFPVRTTGHDFLHSCRHFYFSFSYLSSIVKSCAFTLGLHYLDNREFKLSYGRCKSTRFTKNKPCRC